MKLTFSYSKNLSKSLQNHAIICCFFEYILVLNTLRNNRSDGKVTTGLLYVDPDKSDLHDTLNTSSKPLNSISMNDLCPGGEELEEINNQFR